MATLAIVISLVGNAWAVSQDGSRRAIKAGDRLVDDENLIMGPGARIDLDFGNNQQISLLGEQQVSSDQRVELLNELQGLESKPVEEETKPAPAASNGFEESSGYGHNFVQLVRIGELIEADGLTPFTIVRIQEVLREFSLNLDVEIFDVQGKYVLIKAGEPVNENGVYTISGNMEKSIWSNASEAVGKKRDIAHEKGALGVLYYDMLSFPRFQGYFQFMKNNNSGRMQLASDAGDEVLIYLNDDAAKTLKSDIEEDNVPKSINTNITMDISSGNDAINSENVVAFIKGSEKPDEYVVISSHLDHIGITADGQINNGADDDGSGTVALLETPQAFKKAAEEGNGPKRS